MASTSTIGRENLRAARTNGAGKTTDAAHVAGLLPPIGRNSHFWSRPRGKNPVEAKRIVAWLPDEPMLYDNSIRSNTWNSSPAYGASNPARRRAKERVFARHARPVPHRASVARAFRVA